MSSIGLVLVAVLISGFSGAPALLFRRASRTGQCLSTVLLVAGGAAGLAGVLPALASTSSFTAFFDFGLPLGRFSLAVDAFGAIFLVPVFVVPALGAIYGLGYRDARKHPGDARRLAPFYGLLVAGMALVIVARDAIAFLLAWELMALASWFTATADSEKPEVRRSGWVYLVATHVGSLVLFAMFALWKAASGSFSLAPGLSIAPEAAGPIFILALVGFGLKAGLVPFHVWLPGAHANAPSHVSGTMSGVMIKLGMYGILRMASIMPTPEAWWGWTLLAVGCVTGVAGIAWATGQGDIKRVLAYSSVENIGIVAMGAGLALLGRSSGRPDLVLLGMGGALFHVWNHSLFKSLLFLDAGFVTHATGTRRLERLGGLAKRMPLAALLFAVGAVAISALPPLNGFAGEWLVYLGFFRGIGEGAGPELPAAAAGAAVLATIGALATAAFVRLFGTVFLGSARSDIPASAGGPSAGPGGDRAPELFMIIPMVLLGVACLVVGLAPGAAGSGKGRGRMGRAARERADSPEPGRFLLDAAARPLALRRGGPFRRPLLLRRTRQGTQGDAHMGLRLCGPDTQDAVRRLLLR